MIREEEIKIKALSEYRIKEKENKKATGTYDVNLPRRKAFIEGAQWADKTMIEKACNWIKANMPNYINFEEGFIYEVDMADDLRKYLEE